VEFQEVVAKRRMVRNFEERPVAAASLEHILKNATHAPSAGFSQGWAFLALSAPEDVARFWDAEWPEPRTGTRVGITRAPVIVVPMSHKQAYLDRYAEPDKGWTDRSESRWTIPFWHVDAGFASMLMLLTAVDEGLGALFFGLRNMNAVKEAFNIPEQHEPIGAIALGHPAPDEPSPSLRRGRRPVAEVVHRGAW